MLASKKNILEGHKLRQQIKWGCVPEMSGHKLQSVIPSKNDRITFKFHTKNTFSSNNQPRTKVRFVFRQKWI